MKKFLSLVLALIMTMSLVTIGASAAEYKDFTDKDEIQYEEAVAVLNRLGIITGYTEGDFRPEGELTRGAAAKIIASLLIGPEAANNLTPTSAPFKDVPLDHTFAGPIAYCSTLKIINGYSDGSFQPGGTLTGYAFSKMLLGALGYDGTIEGFTGSGWSMNVMRLGGEAGLFDSISFKGNDPVNREEAAQLALNTLKATLVEYTGGLNITAGDATINSDPTRTYVISNQEFATHINNRKSSEAGNANVTTHHTVEFGEQHFVDLRMTYDRNTIDDFGRPSNEWSYKKVTIGTFPVEPDYIYTEQMEHNVPTVTNATKARALGLTGFEVEDDSEHPTKVYVNGKLETTKLTNVGEIANYTDNGTVVEVYVSEDDADFIESVVVVKTQLMEVKRIGADYVSLDLYDNGSAGKSSTGSKFIGFNQAPIDEKVKNVEVDDDYYTMLSGLKVGNRVAVVPVTTDEGASYTVAKAYVPETASGKLSRVETYGNTTADPSTIGVTVGDTAYDVALWNKDLVDIDGTKLDVTTKDVTLTLDEFGNALLAEDVGATSDFMIVGSYYSSLVNGKLVTYVKGWDISGEELTLNLGSKESVKPSVSKIAPGDLAYYSNAKATGDADWALSESPINGVFTVFTDHDNEVTGNALYSVKASNTRIRTVEAYKDTTTGSIKIGDKYTANDDTDAFKPWIDKNIKFIYVTIDTDSGDVDYIDIKSGVQEASNEDLRARNTDCDSTYGATSAQAAVAVDSSGNVKSDGGVKAVVIKNESNDAVATNMLYIVNYLGSATKTDENGDIVYGYTVAMNGPDGIIDDAMTIYSTKRLNRGDWARYTEVQDDNFENFYTLKKVDQRLKATSTMDVMFSTYIPGSKFLVSLNANELTAPNSTTKLGANDVNIDSQVMNLGAGDNQAPYLVSLRYARFVDLSGNGIDNYEDLYDLTNGSTKEFDLNSVKASIIFNDDSGKDNFRQIAMIVIKSVNNKVDSSTTPEQTGSVQFGTGVGVGTGNGQYGRVSGEVSVRADGKATANIILTKPDWAYTADDAEEEACGSSAVDRTRVIVTYEVVRKGDDKAWGTGTIEGYNKAINYLDAAGTQYFRADAARDTYSINGLDLNGIISAEYAKDQELSVVITKVEWTYVKVEKYIDDVSAPLANEKACLSIYQNHNAVSFPISLPGIGTGDVKYEVTGVEGLAKPATGTFSAGDYASIQLAGTTVAPYAAGGSAIIVKLTKPSGFQEMCDVVVDSGATGKTLPTYTGVSTSGVVNPETVTLSLTAKTSTVGKGKTAVVEVKLSGAPADYGVYAYKVTVKGADGPVTLKDGTAANMTFTVSDDINITLNDITVEPLKRAYVTDAEWDGSVLILHYSEAITRVTNNDADNASANINSVISDDGMTVTLTITEVDSSTHQTKVWDKDDGTYDGAYTNYVKWVAKSSGEAVAMQIVNILDGGKCAVVKRT